MKMSTAYHPKTDASSECFNQTIIQFIHFHVEWNQKGWTRVLPRIHFNIMNSINKLTGFSPFQLHMGRSPRILPPLIPSVPPVAQTPLEISARTLMDHLIHDVWEA